MENINVSVSPEKFDVLVHGMEGPPPLQQVGPVIDIAAKPEGTENGNPVIAISFQSFVPNVGVRRVQAVTTLANFLNAVTFLQNHPDLKIN